MCVCGGWGGGGALEHACGVVGRGVCSFGEELLRSAVKQCGVTHAWDYQVSRRKVHGEKLSSIGWRASPPPPTLLPSREKLHTHDAFRTRALHECGCTFMHARTPHNPRRPQVAITTSWFLCTKTLLARPPPPLPNKNTHTRPPLVSRVQAAHFARRGTAACVSNAMEINWHRTVCTWHCQPTMLVILDSRENSPQPIPGKAHDPKDPHTQASFGSYGYTHIIYNITVGCEQHPTIRWPRHCQDRVLALTTNCGKVLCEKTSSRGHPASPALPPVF